MKANIKKVAPRKDIPAEVGQALQEAADDITSIINGGLSMKDGNLPFELFQGRFTSGVARELDAVGAFVIFSESPVTKTSYKTLKNSALSLTLTFEDTKSNAMILLIKEKP